MLKQKKLCNGEQNDKCCVHYWTGVRGLDSHNPEFLRKGGKVRFCTQWTPEPLQFEEGTAELWTECSRYRVDPKMRPYDAAWENPIPLEGLTEPVIPDAPLPEIHGGNDDEMSRPGYANPPTTFKSVGVGIDDALDAPPADAGTKESA